MKKTKFLALFLALAFVIMGTGYAAWSNTLVVANSATTGNLNVQFVDGKLLGLDLLKYAPLAGTSDIRKTMPDPTKPTQIINWISAPSGYASATAKIDTTDTNSRTLNVTINNLYPGSLGLITAAMQNNSSIPAVFKGADVNFDTPATQADIDKLDNLKNKLLCAGGFIKIDKATKLPIPGTGKVFYNVPLGQLGDTLAKMLKDVRLEKGEAIALDIPDQYKDEVAANVEAYDKTTQNCLMFYLPSSVSNDDNVQGVNASFQIHLDWTQF
jgi:hypothetical protein